MNPELQRNLWLEVSLPRVVLMLGVLAAIFAVTGLTGSMAEAEAGAVAGAAGFCYFVIVGVWGTFKAARAVSDEIRDRTWDVQRMSGLSPWAMMTGKLFGATAYVWIGGLACLAVLTIAQTPKLGALDALRDAGALALVGLAGHAAALAASIAGARRRRGQGRVDAFLFQLAGLSAYWAVDGALRGLGLRTFMGTMTEDVADVVPVDWWGYAINPRHFADASIVVGVIVLVLTAWRLMRVELQAPARPIWWLALALVPILWAAGFADAGVQRLGMAFTISGILAYATIVIEPKDIVAWRAMTIAGLREPAKAAALWPASLTALALAWALAVATAIAQLFMGDAKATAAGFLAAPAMAAFLTRDMAIFAFFHLAPRQTRGDFAAIITIALLYGLPGPFLAAMDAPDPLRALVSPILVEGIAGDGVSAAAAMASGAVQAVIAILLAKARWAARTKTV